MVRVAVDTEDVDPSIGERQRQRKADPSDADNDHREIRRANPVDQRGCLAA
jgi:hypothetical protein